MKRYQLTNGISSVWIKAKSVTEAKAKLKGLQLDLNKYKLVEVE